MLAMGLDEDFVRGYLRRHFEIFRRHRTPFDITLKDVETVHREPQNVARWVAVVREEIERFF